jgi:ATP-dependent Clp protease ATP-binding subunit ClpA
MKQLAREDVLKMSIEALQQVMNKKEGLAQVIDLGVTSEAVSNRIDEVLDREFAAMTSAEQERITRLADRVRRKVTGG